MSNTSFPSRSSRRGVAFEPLESRLLLSADLVPAADALAPEPSLVPAEHRSLAALEPAPLVSMRLAARELVFVDGSIADRDRLLADFLGAAGSARAFDVVVLDPARDGLAQIGEALAGRSGLAAVHVLGHGADGALALGGTTLDAATLAARADAIAAWGAAFAADGDFLLYGCDVASSARGAAFLAELARATGADVAASDDLTGAAARGGDWDLEYASGAIETLPVPVADATWGGLLTTEVLDWDDPGVDWPAAGVGANSFAVGGANVTITVDDPSGYLNNGSPDDDTLNDEGGLGVIEQGLYVSSTGFDPGESATITLDFAHPGGVSNVSFTIFDIDVGGPGNFIDEIQAGFTASGAVTLTIANGPNNTVLGGDTVQGTTTTPSTGAGSGDANATFTFTGNGITQITLSYRNFGGASGQSVTLHDVSFDPTPTASNRTVATSEDAAYTFAAGDFGFADVGGDTLQAVRVTQLESAGALRLNGVDVVLNQVVAIADINAGRLTFAPAADANGAPYANFRFRVGDGASFSVADYEMRIDASAVGDTVNDATATNEDNAVAFNVLANDNFENAGRTLTAVAGAANGGVSFTAAGAVTYTPNLHWNGTETLTYTVTSGGATETGTLTVTVNAVNDAPTLAIGANQTVAEDTPAQTVVAFATAAPGGGADEAGQTFTYTVTNDNNAMFAVQPSIAANGTLTYTLAANAFGTANVSVSVTDSGGGTDTTGPLAFTITATPVADTPSVTNAATLEDVQTVGGLVISRNAADGAEVTHFRITGIAGGTLFLNDGTTVVASGAFITAAEGAAGLKFTPSTNSIAAGSFDVQASTAANAGGLAGGVVAATITVTAVNDVPTLALGANQTLAEDAPAQTVVAFATAAPGGGADEAGQTFTYAVTNDNNAMFTVQPSIAANGTLTYTLAANTFGTANVSVSVTDSGGGTDTTGPLAFTVTATPVADTPAVTNAATLEDVQTTVGLVITRNAADGAEVTHFRITGIAGGTLFLNDGTTTVVTGTFITAAQGAAGLKFTPSANSVAAGSFDVQASTAGNAGGLGGGVVTATIAVTPVNDEPSFTVGGNLAVAEDAAPQTIAAYANAASGGGGDEAGQTFSYTVTNDNNGLFTVQPSVAADGTLTYTLAVNASGAATVTVFVTDSGGTANFGDDTAPVQMFTIAVTAVADPPTLTVNAPTGNEDTPIGLSIAPALVDTDGSETLTLNVSSIPIGATLTDGISSFTATLGNTATAITGWNLAALTVLPPLHSDVDFTLIVAATATEGAGGAAVTTANLAVTVTAVADAPTLVVNAPTGNEDTAIGLSIAPALVDADGSETLTLSVSSIPIGATLTDGISSFTATLGNTATAITGWNLAALTVLPPLHSDVDFTLIVAATATEGAGGAAVTTANLAVTVTAVADAPTLVVNAPTGNEDTAIGLSIAPALVDADGSETLTLSVSSIPIGATLTDGISSFTATLGNTATAITGWNLAALTVLPPLHSDVDFTLIVAATATEGAGGAAVTTANLAVTVTAVADAPTLVVNAPTGNEDTAIGLSIAPALVDADGSETLTLSVSSIPIGATLTDGVSSFTATLGNTATAITGWNLAALTVLPPLHSDVDFTLIVAATATEGAGGIATTTANLAVTVTAVADAPTLVVNAPTGNEDTAIGLSIAPALVDADGSETLTLSVSSIPIGATLTDGVSSFTATLGNTATAITGWNLAALTVLPPLHSDVDFTLIVAATATEGAGGIATTTANLAVTVTAVADAPTLVVNAPTGNEDTPIGLSIAPALVDTDGSETLTLNVSSIPIGATLTDGVSSFTATLGNTATAITGWNLAALTVLPPLHSDVDFTLVVAATATEGAGGAAVTTANLAVTVTAVADAPTLAVNPAVGNEDTAIGLSITPALVDADGSETLSLTVSSIPVGATLSDGLNTFIATAGNQTVNVTGWNLAALTITPAANADADFNLTVTATSTEAANGSATASVAGLAVDVLPVNDAPTVAAPAVLGVVEDVPSPLLGISFGDVDAGAGLVTATFTVAQGTLAATAGGGIAVGGTATARTLTGTLAGVNAFLAGGGLSYTTVLDATAPVALTASLNDLGNSGSGGALASPAANVTLDVTPVNDAPMLGNVALAVEPGGTVVLTGANLSATDVDDPLAGLVFFIAGLQNGRFELVGAPGVPISTFTQGQVLAGQVQFVQTDMLRAPAYIVFVTDGASTVGPGIVALSFRAVIDPGAGASVGTALNKDGRDATVLPTVSFAGNVLDALGGGLADPFAIRFNRAPVVATDGGEAAPAEAELPPAAGARDAAKTGDAWEFKPRGFAYPELGFGEMDRLPTAVAPLEFGVGPDRPHEELRGVSLALDAIRTAGLVMSVGAVWWAARAAGLVGSLLASTPAWRHMDPLPVLGRDGPAGGWEEPEGEEATKEDASATKMFDADADAKQQPAG